MARNHSYTPQPFPRIADFGYGKTLNQQYAKIKKEMRPCISGLMDYAANLALTDDQSLLPDLREMVVSMGPFWEDSGDERIGWRQTREQHYGEAFDQVVSAAQESGQAPVMDSKKIEQIFAGLNYHAEERSADLDTYSIWQCCRMCRRLQQEWEGKTERPLVFNGGFEVDYSDTFTNFGCKSPEDVQYGKLFGRPVLIFNHPIDLENIPSLWHCYHLTGRDIVHPDKLVDAVPEEGYAGTVLSPFSLKRPSCHSRQISEQFRFSGMHVTLDAFCQWERVPCPDLNGVFQEQSDLKEGLEFGMSF